MKGLLAAVIAATLIAGCGSQSIESRVQSGYATFATNHRFDAKAKNVDRVTCTKEATTKYDGWCRILAKGFHITYDVPYKGETVYWGASGLLKAP